MDRLHEWGGLIGLKGRGAATVFDPCAGTGRAIAALRDLWGGSDAVVACEMERDRARSLRRRFLQGQQDKALSGDAFCLEFSVGAVSVLFLNPPYDHDREFGRLEVRWLERFAPAVRPGGALLALFPKAALAKAEGPLSREFEDLRIFAMPENPWGQVVIVGRRRVEPAREMSWCPAEIPPLPCRPETLVVRRAFRDWGTFRMERLDYRSVRWDVGNRWDGAEDSSPSALWDRKTPCLMPPRREHIARVLADGQLNGLRVVPDPGQAGPPILLKGTARRRLVKIGETRTEKTRRVSFDERPSLSMTVMDLDRLECVELDPRITPGEVPGALETVGDLFQSYQGSIRDVLSQSFPAEVDPARRDDVEIPKLERAPRGDQGPAIRGMLRMLGRGNSCPVIGQVGSGKTTTTAILLAMLHPSRYDRTRGELARVGADVGRLPKVRRSLVLCPPHLTSTWVDEVAATASELRVQVVTCRQDLDVEADVYVLSREKAKLGHGWRGIAGDRCPSCGAELDEDSAMSRAAKRLRCSAESAAPNAWARWSGRLAGILASMGFSGGHLAQWQRHHHQVTAEGAEGALRRLVDEMAAAGEAEAAARIDLAVSEWHELAAGAEDWKDQADVVKSVCGEPLFQATSPRRIPIADWIVRTRWKFELLVVDEFHEFAAMGSAQSKACGRLVATGVPLIGLSGSMMSGVASSVFGLWKLLGRLPGFGRREISRFVDEFGMRRREWVGDISAPVQSFGSVTDREMGGYRSLGEAAGIMPSFLVREVLPSTVFLGVDASLLPPVTYSRPTVALGEGSSAQLHLFDQPEPTDLEREWLALYGKIVSAVRDRAKKDRFTKRAGALFGRISRLPHLADRLTADQWADGVIELRYPERFGSDVIVRAPALPASFRTPKEVHLSRRVAAWRAKGRRVLVLILHTRTGLPERLLRILGEVPGVERPVYLDAERVSASKRDHWLRQSEADVLIANATAVQTGLNSLVRFDCGFWFELPYDARTVRQADGRIVRPGQMSDRVVIETPVQAGTLQPGAQAWVESKMHASRAFEGMDQGDSGGGCSLTEALLRCADGLGA